MTDNEPMRCPVCERVALDVLTFRVILDEEDVASLICMRLYCMDCGAQVSNYYPLGHSVVDKRRL
jgi:hypothetical protein